MARIDIAGLTKSYIGRNAARAVDSIDLAIKDGEVMALVGPSGCGKTTTLQLLAGFLKPDAGTITVGDRVVSTAKHVVPPERRRMSLIFQSYAVWPHKTVFENVAYGLRVMKLSRSEIEDRTTAVLRTVRMTDLAQRYPSELSGGQQQRVALARAVVVNPETLLLDEPLSNLDANLREEMRFEIRRIHDTTGITMVYVTHDQTEAMVAADRIALMRGGKIAQVGTAHEIYEKPATAFVATFVGGTNTLPATLIEPHLVECCGARLRVRDDFDAATRGPVTLCIRPHAIGFAERNGDDATGYRENGMNRLAGTVLRQTYLGAARDYLIDLGGAQIRMAAPPSVDRAVGSTVHLDVAVDACRVVPGD
ncbi:MAG: iron(III) transport system ATP-binding protein [Candidatus Eremiobacteraeota bacterium]|jgi:iron(III) transport system ATP-binding protein|nr:iron(III) transport system ATP-binding protein [Candidatus Eremiobacteraeota bacterium]